MELNLELAQYKVFVLVGGLGTRLRPAYAEGPKAMAPIAGQPFLSYLLRQLKTAGFSQVVLCVGFAHELIEQWASCESHSGMNIEFSVEDEPLGTAGAVRLAAQRHPVDRSFFAMNGDSMLQLDFSEMIRFHAAHAALGTVGLATVPDTSRYGAVELDGRDQIVAFREKSDARVPGYINGGVYIFEPAILQRISPQGAVSLERAILPELCPTALFAFKTGGYFLDIGVPEDFHRAQIEFRELKWL
jgi:D-glycero-alpha-D-manno-heptose 1-phosphate guanylyltransferase